MIKWVTGDERVNWVDYFLNIAQVVSLRSYCCRLNVGAVVVSKDNNIISTGYNGTSRGEKHCGGGNCQREILNIPHGERYELCRSVHAEQNAIINAARLGTSTIGSTIYITHKPCKLCERMIKNAGIENVIYSSDC